MLDLNEQPTLPRYELKAGEETKSYDPLVLSYALRALEGVEDPEKIQLKVCEAFGIEVDAFTATVILKDFFEFAEKELEEPLKKVFGQGLSSIITSVSAPESSKD